MQQGWEAAVQGIPLSTYAKQHPELQQAISKFAQP
jgi:ribulose-bisphosphate carboxylase large chain